MCKVVSSSEWFISVYRLVVDAKPVRVIVWLGQIIWKSQSSYKEFAPTTQSMARRDICINHKVWISVFVNATAGKRPQ